jgi:CBS domain-containing protein
MPTDRLQRALCGIDAAGSVAGLRSATAELPSAVGELVGARATTVTQAWSTLMRAALRTAARLIAPTAGTWYASGSVGRGEALPGSDLDTLFVRAETISPDAALHHALEVHDVLSTCGFRGDDNGVTAARSRFNRSARQWAAGIERWTTDAGSDRGVVMIGLLADAVPITDGPDLAGQVGAAARSHPDALAAMLQDATYVRTHVPSRLRVLTTRDSGVDVKAAVVDPVVRIARWAALSCGSHAPGTSERISDAAGSRFLDVEDAEVLTRCHAIGSSIRWRMRAAQLTTKGGPASEHVDLSVFAPQDRTALRSIGREVSGLQRKLDYLASTSAFSTW